MRLGPDPSPGHPTGAFSQPQGPLGTVRQSLFPRNAQERVKSLTLYLHRHLNTSPFLTTQHRHLSFNFVREAATHTAKCIFLKVS